MTGHAVKGYSGFLPKDGENFNRRLNVRLHDDAFAALEAAKKPGDSLADVIRRAVSQYVEREKRAGSSNHNGD